MLKFDGMMKKLKEATIMNQKFNMEKQLLLTQAKIDREKKFIDSADEIISDLSLIARSYDPFCDPEELKEMKESIIKTLKTLTGDK